MRNNRRIRRVAAVREPYRHPVSAMPGQFGMNYFGLPLGICMLNHGEAVGVNQARLTLVKDADAKRQRLIGIGCGNTVHVICDSKLDVLRHGSSEHDFGAGQDSAVLQGAAPGCVVKRVEKGKGVMVLGCVNVEQVNGGFELRNECV